jgi:hypothetical protein
MIDPEKLRIIRRLHQIEVERASNVEQGSPRLEQNERAQLLRFRAVMHCSEDELKALFRSEEALSDIRKGYPRLEGCWSF